MEYPFLDRFAASAKHGFKGVEFSQPYDVPAQTLSEILEINQLEQVMFNLPAGDWAAGERGIACHPNRVSEFQDGVGLAISYAQTMGNHLINCLAGIKPDGVSTTLAFDTLVSNLSFAGRALHSAGLTLLVEPINPYDMPGFFLNTSTDAMRAIDATGDPHIKLQYDIYHMQRVEGQVSDTIRRLIPRIGHFQCAGVPGRTEPDRGDIAYADLFALIDQLGYGGWIGAEYKPTGTTVEGLGWLQKVQT